MARLLIVKKPARVERLVGQLKNQIPQKKLKNRYFRVPRILDQTILFDVSIGTKYVMRIKKISAFLPVLYRSEKNCQADPLEGLDHQTGM